MKKLNLKNFTILELKKYFKLTEKLCYDIFIKIEGIEENEPLTISDHITCSIYKGSENLYFDFLVYKARPENEKSFNVELYTKEAHELLKIFIKLLITQL